LVLEAVHGRGGEASVLEVAKDIWTARARDLEASGDLFFTWQYDMRWAADRLRKAGKLRLSGRESGL
jgi:hypothetical protein